MHLGHFRWCSISCVSRNTGSLQLYRKWELLLHGLDKYTEQAGGRLQTATHIDFAREVNVSNPISYRYSISEPGFESDLPETLERSLSSFSEVKSLRAEQRLVTEKVVHGRDVFAQLPTGFGKSLTFQILLINHSMHLITDNGNCIPPVNVLGKNNPEPQDSHRRN